MRRGESLGTGKKDINKFVAVLSERERGRSEQRPPRQGPSQLGRDQPAICKKYGDWKYQCPKKQQSNREKRGRSEKKKSDHTCLKRLRRTSKSCPRKTTGYKIEAGWKRVKKWNFWLKVEQNILL